MGFGLGFWYKGRIQSHVIKITKMRKGYNKGKVGFALKTKREKV